MSIDHEFVNSERFQKSFRVWVERYAWFPNRVTWKFRPGAWSWVDLSRRLGNIDPATYDSDTLGPEARALTDWGGKTYTPRALRILLCRFIIGHELSHVNWTQMQKLKPLHHNLFNILEDERIERLMERLHWQFARDRREWARRATAQKSEPKGNRTADLLNACLTLRYDSQDPGKHTPLEFSDPGDAFLFDNHVRNLALSSFGVYESTEVADIAAEILKVWGLDPEKDAAPAPGLLLPSPGDPKGEMKGEVVSGSGMAPIPGGEVGTGHGDHVEKEPILERPVATDPGRGTMWHVGAWSLMQEVQPLVADLVKNLIVPGDEHQESWARSQGIVSVQSYVGSRRRYPFIRSDTPGPRSRPVLGLVVDDTGSMGGRPLITSTGPIPEGEEWFDYTDPMPHCRKALMMMQLACEKAQIPLSVAACSNGREEIHKTWASPRRDVTYYQDPVRFIQYLTRPDYEQAREMIAGLYGSGGYEEVTWGLRAMAKELLTQEGHRVLVYLHDGEPNETAEEIQKVLGQVRRQGITVLGLFLGPEHNADRLRRIFGASWTLVVPETGKLPTVLGRLLKSLRE